MKPLREEEQLRGEKAERRQRRKEGVKKREQYERNLWEETNQGERDGLSFPINLGPEFRLECLCTCIQINFSH